MFRHKFCGGKHTTVAEARECEQKQDTVASPVEVKFAPPNPNPPFNIRMSNRQPVSDGFYRTPHGFYYKVVHAVHGSGHPYAKKLIVHRESVRDESGKILIPASLEWEHAKGAQFQLREEWKLTLEQAGEFGKLYGQCIKCGRPLTKEESIGRGMGDICAGLSGKIQVRVRNTQLYRKTSPALG